MIQIESNEVLVSDFALVFSPVTQKWRHTEIINIGHQFDSENPEGCRCIVCDDGLTYRLSDGKCISPSKESMSFESLWRKEEYERELEAEREELVAKQDEYYQSLSDKLKEAVMNVIKSEMPDIPENAVLVHTYDSYGTLRLHMTVKKSLYSDRIDEIRNELESHYEQSF